MALSESRRDSLPTSDSRFQSASTVSLISLLILATNSLPSLGQAKQGFGLQLESAQTSTRTTHPDTSVTNTPVITVSPNVVVTGSRKSRPHGEVTVCASPVDPQRLTIGVMYDRGGVNYPPGKDIGFYSTFDRGRHWTLGLDVRHASDPTCVYGNDGSVYVAYMMLLDRSLDFRDVALQRSSDGGLHWNAAVLAGNGKRLDRPWLSYDSGAGSFSGNVYLSVLAYDLVFEPKQTATMQVYLMRSRDAGRTVSFSKSLPLLSGTQPGQVAVLSDGTIVHAYWSYIDSAVAVVISHDGGETLSDAQLISIKSPEREGPIAGHKVPTFHFIPMLAVDQTSGPFRDRIYVVWTQLSSGRVQVWFTFSNDKGLTWRPARPIDDAQAFDPKQPWRGPHNVNPAIAVNRNGIVGVSWDDRRATMTRGYWPRFIASLDGGETWSAGVNLTPSPTREVTPTQWHVADMNGFIKPKTKSNRPLLLAFTPRSRFYEPGDHSGLAADASGVFHPVWVDDRTGVDQIWTATVRVDGEITVRKDVTDRVGIIITDSKYDSATKSATVTIIVKNESSQPLFAPLLLQTIDRAALPDSSNKPEPGGAVFPTNADNSWKEPGGIWALPLRTDTISLLPGESTSPVTLEFHAPSSRTPASFALRVFGKATGE